MRTKTDINAEVKKLAKMKPNVRRTSMFGDNHHDAIDAQILVLTSLDEDEFDERFDGEPDNVRSAAQDALDWLLGDKDELPSDEWESLLIK